MNRLPCCFVVDGHIYIRMNSRVRVSLLKELPFFFYSFVFHTIHSIQSFESALLKMSVN